MSSGSAVSFWKQSVFEDATALQLIAEAFGLFLKYDIDPIFGRENLVWLQLLLDKTPHFGRAAKSAEGAVSGGGREEIADALETLGQQAAKLRKTK